MKLPAVSLGAMQIHRIVADVMLTEMGMVRVRAVLDVNDVRAQDGHRADVGQQHHCMPEVWMKLDDAGRRALIREQVIAAVTHEVDEWLRVDGERVTDPHPDPYSGGKR